MYNVTNLSFGKILILFKNKKCHTQITLYITMGMYIYKLNLVYIF